MRPTLKDAGRLGRAGTLRDHGARRGAAALAAVSLIVLLIAAAAVIPSISERAAAADDLTRQALIGPRNLTCQRVVLLLDQSGSMTEYAQVRTDAMTTLGQWAPDNLRADDELSVVRWADTAIADTPPTRVDALTSSSFTAGSADVGGGTDVLPAVRLVADLASTPCRTSLVFISDGQIAQAHAAQLDAALQKAGVDRVSLVLPNATATPEYWMRLFPYAEALHADPNNPNQTARALGQAIASATGQQLQVQR